MTPDPQLTGMVGWVTDVIASLGPVGVGLLVALENLFPPIPSEAVLPFAGFVAGRDGVGPWIMVLAATVGSVVGAAALYELGRGIGLDRTRALLVRLPLVQADEVDRTISWFHDHGRWSVLLGRLIPLIRSLVSLPAGADGMPRSTFLLLTTIGSAVWNTLWIWGGYLLGSRWEQAGTYSTVMNVGLVVAVAAVVVHFVWTRRHRIRPAMSR